MSQFNIINGLRDIFDDTCTRQVVSCLIRNSLIWDFLAEEKNFRETKKIIGNNQNNWTISKIVQAAAGFNNVYEIKGSRVNSSGMIYVPKILKGYKVKLLLVDIDDE